MPAVVRSHIEPRDCLLVIECDQEQSCQTMNLKLTLVGVVLASVFEDAVDAHARSDYAKALYGQSVGKPATQQPPR
ncbi:hypothetical protein BSZ19_41460 [Bradyrhizobium japonicum]|jgi:hypothetical protein|uniref:Uncharacterized protein n=1 Tax=Bradyrhizobium japonicum TaxID=375 RepID=A0A1Y2JB62_BRAJP|nr:hypothetical protein BSZ19_41460 [Bradyrhizobium japonicum]